MPIHVLGSVQAYCHLIHNLLGQVPHLSSLVHSPPSPVAEKTYLTFRSTASAHPSIRFIAISHSDRLSTDRWLDSIGGPTPSKVEVIVDNERSLYAAWGRGASSYWHALFPAALGSAIKLGREEGLWNRPTESGSLWQTSGSWVVDVGGVVRWGGASGRMDEIPDFEEAVKAVEGH